MKKFIIFLGVFMLFLFVPIQAQTHVTYKIYLDSHSEESYEIKEEVVAILDYLCDQVDKDSYGTMVSQNLDAFESIENASVSWKKQTLSITIGDGKGTYIKGDYKKSKVCIEEVKPRSKILDWLGI